MLELFSPEWLASLAAIIAVDLLLAGDNAIVIALAARKLPKHLQKRTIIIGTLGAVLVRVLFVFFALQLLKIKGISIFGGLILFYVAWRLIVPPKNAAQKTPTEADNLWAAIKTILIADTIMGLDNILAIAGASRGDLTLVIIGFLISIPIMMGGSVIILKWFEKAPWLVSVGGGLLFIIALRMVLDDPWTRSVIELSTAVEWSIIISVAATLTAAAVFTERRGKGRDGS